MKKTLLSIGLVLAVSAAQAQVTTYVLEPEDQAGALTFTWADNWGLTPDLNDPANTIQEYTVFADDGTVGDSLACEALVNGAEMAGKIAVLYRGTCEFGLKALNAENAGAIGVVIITNNPDAPIPMGAGANGALVTVPVVMISQAAGADLKSNIEAGIVKMLIGSVQGIFPNNASMLPRDMLLPRGTGTPQPVASNASEFDVPLGSWVHNFGTSVQTGLTISAVITKDGSTLYDETSDAVSVPVADSVFIELPTFSQSTYGGFYELNYSINSTVSDDFPSDNSFATNFSVDQLLAVALLDPSTGLPAPDQFTRAGGTPLPAFQSCIQFKDANASRLKAEGMYAAASFSGAGSIEGKTLTARIIEWNDPVTGVSDATFTDISEIMSGEYTYDSDVEEELVYIPFFDVTTLEDDQRYLFCVYVETDSVFLGHNGVLNYDENQNTTDQFATIVNDPTGWFAGGFGSDLQAAIGVKMVSTSGINELGKVDVTPYPNPTANFLRIPVQGLTGMASLTVFDVNGAKVIDQRVNVGGDQILTVDLASFTNGIYLFHMDMENGKHAEFRVVVSK